MASLINYLSDTCVSSLTVINAIINKLESKVLLMTTYCLRLFVVLQALNVVASEIMVGDTCDTCIPSKIVNNTTINQLETNIF